ncbi:MAG TPA: hypothetical protein VFV99_15175, partial [Kofleriaceae bacterium]|nr:hypothetical protein [Kofleriaceae bacterium]
MKRAIASILLCLPVTAAAQPADGAEPAKSDKPEQEKPAAPDPATTAAAAPEPTKLVDKDVEPPT